MNIDLKNIGGKKNALIIMVGPPASGKSTLGKKLAEQYGIVYVSTDRIRAEIGKGEGDQSVSPAAFSIAKKRISQALALGKHAMIDATSVDPKSRKDWVNIGRGAGAYVIAIAFEVPTQELYRRDAERERHVGNEIIDVFVKRYQRPTTSEVDHIIIE